MLDNRDKTTTELKWMQLNVNHAQARPISFKGSALKYDLVGYRSLQGNAECGKFFPLLSIEQVFGGIF